MTLCSQIRKLKGQPCKIMRRRMHIILNLTYLLQWFYLMVLRVAVARYRVICFVLVKSHLFPLPRGAGSTVSHLGFKLSVIFLASLLVFPMLGCRHSLLRHGNMSNSLVECTFLNIPTCVHLPVGVHFLAFFAFTFR